MIILTANFVRIRYFVNWEFCNWNLYYFGVGDVETLLLELWLLQYSNRLLGHLVILLRGNILLGNFGTNGYSLIRNFPTRNFDSFEFVTWKLFLIGVFWLIRTVGMFLGAGVLYPMYILWTEGSVMYRLCYWRRLLYSTYVPWSRRTICTTITLEQAYFTRQKIVASVLCHQYFGKGVLYHQALGTGVLYCSSTLEQTCYTISMLVST